MAIRFVDAGSGNDANDGLDNIGVGLATATWTEATLTLTQNGHGYTFAAGDVIYISGGTGATVGLYEVASSTANDIVLVGTSTLPTVGNATDFAAGDLGAGNITSSNGPDISIQAALSAVSAGDHVWVRSGTSYNEALTTSTVGTALLPVIMEGYTTSLGDEGVPTNDGTTGSLAEGWTPNSSDNFYVWKNFYFRDFTGTCFGNLIGDHVYLYRIRASGGGSNGIELDDNCVAIACHAHNNTGRGINLGGVCSVHSCVVHDNTSTGIDCNTGGTVVGCLSYNNAGTGINLSATGSFVLVAHNTVIAPTASTLTGLRLGPTNDTNVVTCFNNTVSGYSGSGGKGIATADIRQRSVIFNNNVFDCETPYDNSSDLGGGTTADPSFVNAAGGDFTPAVASPLLEAGLDVSKAPGIATQTTQSATVGALLGASVGSCDYPAVGDVEEGVTFDTGGQTGTFVVPAVGDVQDAVTYGSAAEFTGTFGAPTQAQVEDGIGFGAGDTEFTGTHSGVHGGGGPWHKY